VLTGNVETFLKQRIQDVCSNYGWEVMSMEVMPDHVHLFVSAEPKWAPLVIAQTLKSILTVDVFKQFQGLKQQHFWGSGLFSRGCYYGSAGSTSSVAIKKYIEEQKHNA
jgi:putative transposase